MTKLEELARKLCDDAEVELDSMGHSRIRVAIQTALKPLLEAAEASVAVHPDRDCQHGEECWYCDSCRLEWEKELGQARVNLREQLTQWRESK